MFCETKYTRCAPIMDSTYGSETLIPSLIFISLFLFFIVVLIKTICDSFTLLLLLHSLDVVLPRPLSLARDQVPLMAQQARSLLSPYHLNLSPPLLSIISSLNPRQTPVPQEIKLFQHHLQTTLNTSRARLGHMLLIHVLRSQAV